MKSVTPDQEHDLKHLESIHGDQLMCAHNIENWQKKTGPSGVRIQNKTQVFIKAWVWETCLGDYVTICFWLLP